MLTRHSSRRNRHDHAVLNQRLEGAVSYDRIAGYFRSSLFEVAGEATAKVAGPVRIICNSDLDPQDLVTAAAAWKVNYELLCEDDAPDTIAWVQEAFDALWNDARVVDLACCPFIAQDVKRIIARRVVEPEEVKATTDLTEAATSAAVELPVYSCTTHAGGPAGRTWKSTSSRSTPAPRSRASRSRSNGPIAR